MEGLSRSFSEKRPDQMVAVSREFARRSPAAFAATTAVVGFALARFLRSSTPEPSGARQTEDMSPEARMYAAEFETSMGDDTFGEASTNDSGDQASGSFSGTEG